MVQTQQSTREEREWKARLSRAAARRARAEADFYSAVAEIGATVSQVHMAAVLHTSQSNVSRWAARGRAEAERVQPGQLASTPYEVAQRYAAGEISRDQMLNALVSWPYQPEEPLPVQEWDTTPVPSGAGTFEETTAEAYRDGLISAEDYDAILDSLATQATDRSEAR